uniref:Uncharacterized protein n=1 Tax=Fagus sylvatica TaxID=28930 RepID=A0A2N9H4U4_FAGSY
MVVVGLRVCWVSGLLVVVGLRIWVSGLLVVVGLRVCCDGSVRAARRGGTRGCGFAGFSGLLGCGFAGFAGDGSVSSWLRVARWDSGWVWGGSGGGFGWLAGSGGAGV